jgi:flagellar protein FliO/FliZ
VKELNAYVNQKMVQCFGFVLCWAPLSLLANDVLTQSAVPSDPMSSIGRVALTLAGMIAFIFLLAYLAKRLQGMSRSNSGGMSGQGKMIKTLATMSMGLKEKISLIQVGDQQLLIGITSQSIQTLLVLETPIKQEDMEHQTPVFQAILKKALRKE